MTRINHIYINVPDIDTATIFLQRAFDAKITYESCSKEQPPPEFQGNETSLNLSPQTKLQHHLTNSLMPWGTSVEFITYPDGMPYETVTNLRRFNGGK